MASTARQHRTGPRRAAVPALAGLLVLSACAGRGAATPPTTAVTTAAPTTTPRTTAAPTTAATTVPKPPSVTLPVPTIVTVPVANSVVAPGAVGSPAADGGGGGGPGGDASGDYGPFGPFNVGSLDDSARRAVASAVEAYLVAASVLPLRNREEPDLRAVLTPGALGRLTAPVLAVLADGPESGLPRLDGVTLEKAEVGVDGIVGPDGGQVAAATIDTVVTAVTEGGSPVRIARRGSLLLVPGPSGWQIDDFDLTVDRDL